MAIYLYLHYNNSVVGTLVVGGHGAMALMAIRTCLRYDMGEGRYGGVPNVEVGEAHQHQCYGGSSTGSTIA